MQLWLGHCPEESSITACHPRLMMTWAQPDLCSFTQHHPLIFILCLTLDHTTSTFSMCIHAFVGAPSLPQCSSLFADWLPRILSRLTWFMTLTWAASGGRPYLISISPLQKFSFFCFVLLNMGSSWEHALHFRISILKTVVRPKRPVNMCSAVVLYPPYLKLSQERPTRGLR